VGDLGDVLGGDEPPLAIALRLCRDALWRELGPGGTLGVVHDGLGRGASTPAELRRVQNVRFWCGAIVGLFGRPVSAWRRFAAGDTGPEA
jgi:hypothetical protein